MSDVNTDSRFEDLLRIGSGMLLIPFLRRQDEGRTLAAIEPVAAPLAGLVRRWNWPTPRQWGSLGSGPGQFNSPQGVAISLGGDIVVCDTNNHRIQICWPDGTFVRMWGSKGAAPGQFDCPYAVAVSSVDEVFVADYHNHRIQVFRLDGSFLRTWGCKGAAPYPTGVAIHGDLVLVSHPWNHRIQCFRLDGTFVWMWGSHGAALGQFNEPLDLAVSASGSQTESATLPLRGLGEVFVCDRGNCRIQVMDLYGTFLRRWGSQGHAPGQFQHPEYVSASYAGEVLVSDKTRVQVFLADGTFVRSLHLPAGAQGAFLPKGVAVMPSGDVVVSDVNNHRIYVEPAGA